MKRPARKTIPPPVVVDVKHQDILRAEADALGCLVTPSLEPGEALTVPVRREYPVDGVGFLILPLPRRLQLLARDAHLLDGLPGATA